MRFILFVEEISFENVPSEQSVSSPGDGKIHCQVGGAPRPEVTWHRLGEVIEMSEYTPYSSQPVCLFCPTDFVY